MQNITEILKEFGLEVPVNKEKEFSRKFNENYKTINEFDNKVKTVETERDNYKARLDTANETLEEFKDIDVKDLQKKIEDYEIRMKTQKEDFDKQIADRDFSDALTKEIEQYKFTSNSAKEAVVNQIKAAGLKLVDGKIMGLNDMITSIKEKDAGAFVDEKQQELENKKARFTTPMNNTGGTEKKISPSELMKLKNENPDLDISQYI